MIFTWQRTVLSKKVISDDSLCSTFKNSDDSELFKILRNETHLSLSKSVLIPRHNLRKARKIMLKPEVIELANNSLSWNRQLMGNVSHRSFFNQLLSNLLVDDTRNLMILLDYRSLSDRHFWALIALKTTLSKENSSSHTSCFKVRNLRRFLKVIFLHLTSAIRTRWSLIIQFRDNFFVVIPINNIHKVDIMVFNV